MAVPSAPTPILLPQTNRHSISLAWEPAFSPDDAPILEYILSVQEGSFAPITIPANQSSFEVIGLMQMMLYTFTIAARNANGVGPAATFLPYQPGCHRYGYI